MKLKNDEGVEITNSLSVVGSTTLDGNVDVTDKNLSGLNGLSFSDPGPDGAIRWTGTNASVYVAPLNDGNEDGFLRIRNDGGISLEDDVRVTGTTELNGELTTNGNVNLTNHNVSNLNTLSFNDPGLDGAIRWNGTGADIFVAPLDGDNVDGFLRVRNDGGISLEDDVRITGNLSLVNGLALENKSVSGVDNITIADPGPDGFITWAGTDARIYVAPDDDQNLDGKLQIKNDGGVRVSSNLQVVGTSTLDGTVALTNKDLIGLNELHFNDPVQMGRSFGMGLGQEFT